MVKQNRTRFVALLRAVNVGGHNKIKMADLRDAMSNAALVNPRTYIQSGNLVFDSTKTAEQLTATLKKLIKSDFGHEVPVLVRRSKFFQDLIARNPFSNRDPKSLHAMVLAATPKPGDLKTIAEKKSGDDEFIVKGDVVYLYCPHGYSKTKLTNRFFETKLKVATTTRNWKTINKLLEMCGE